MLARYYTRKSAYLAGIVILTTCFSVFSDSIPGLRTFAPEKSGWCWAAVCECLVKYWDPLCTKTQAEIAGVLTSQNAVPDEDSLPLCLEENGKQVDLQVEYIQNTISWQEVKREADAKRPFLFLIRLKSGGYHCNVFAGYIGDSTKLKFMEPSEGGSGSFVYRSWTNTLNLPQNKGKWERTMLTSAGSTSGNNFSIPLSSNNFKIVQDRMQHSGKGVTFLFIGSSQDSRVLRIHNSIGKCVYESSFDGNVTQVSWNDVMPSGMYYVFYGYKNRDGLTFINKQFFSVVK